MKRKAITGLIVAAMISMAAGCGSAQNTAASVPAQTDASAVKSEAALTEVQSSVQEAATPVQKETAASATTDVSVEYIVSNYDSYADDGTLLYVASFTRPQVTIQGNKEAQDKINAHMEEMELSLKERKEEFDTKTLEAYETYKTVEKTIPYNNGYSRDKKWDENYQGEEISTTVSLVFADDEFISFRFEDYDNLASANGNNWVDGLVFDAKTGFLVSYLDIFEKDTSGALDYIESKVKENLETEYKDILFDDYMDHTGEFIVMKGDGGWYVTEEGFVAVIQESIVTPHFAGTIETTVPWAELNSFR